MPSFALRRIALAATVLPAAAVLAALVQVTTTSSARAAQAPFHMRFPSPLRWSHTLTGEISAEAPSRCHVNAEIHVGRTAFAKRTIAVGDCGTEWQPLRVHVTARSANAILSRARREHRRPVLFVQVVGVADGSSRVQAHAGAFIVEIAPPPAPSPPGTTRIELGAAVFSGATTESLRGHLLIHTPTSWKRTTKDRALHATFSVRRADGCSVTVFAAPKATATRANHDRTLTPI